MSGTVTKQSNFKRILADRSSRNFLILAIVLILAMLFYFFFYTGNATKGEVSRVSSPSLAQSTQGSVPPTPAYRDNLSLADKERHDDAEKHNLGQSSMKTIVADSTTDKLAPTLNPQKEVAPTPPLPQVQLPTPTVLPDTKAQPTPAPQVAVQPPRTQIIYVPQPVQPTDPALSAAMAQMMGHIMKQNEVPTAVTTQFANNATVQGEMQGTSQSSNNGFVQNPTPSYVPGYTGANYNNASYGNSGNSRSRFKSPAPGTILYSHLVGQVNSDTPGPVIGEVLQGPFSGARLLGTFQFSEQGVLITFNTMTVPYKDQNGADQTEVMPIKAVAVDTSHLGTAMATDIDRHLFEQIAVGFATSFLQGLGAAVASSGSTTVLDPTGAAVLSNPVRSTGNQLLQAGGTAAGTVGQIFNRAYGNRRTTVTVDADTPFGLLFLNSSNQ